jgi:YidC/Oxa1 family membrane protein insertase
LRQESFLWVHDLSAFDSLISWNKDLWIIGDHISLFCLLFSVTQIINTYYTSKLQAPMATSPEMEQQQKVMRWMMYLMPVMFFFVFNDYSAGLNYYYFLSTLFSIIIALYLRKSIKEDELLKKMEAYAEKNKDSAAKQTNMMARLEALQEQQKKLLEERERIKNNRKK